MISPVFIAECKLPPICEKEVLRYAGDQTSSPEIISILKECLKESGDRFNTKVAYRIFPIERTTNILKIGSLLLSSKSLKKNLESCEQVIIFAATAGLEIDRLITKYAKLSPVRSLMFHSIGAERVEALCDAFCNQITKNENLVTVPRFSPGYGDLSLEVQKDILTLLNANNTIGIGLNESLMLSPSKSVTAFVGIKR